MKNSRRFFLRQTAGALAFAPLIPTLIAPSNRHWVTPDFSTNATAATDATRPADSFTLPPLGYDYSALEPYIDAQTMMLHHDKHHQTYVTNLNTAVGKYPDLQKKSPEELITNLNSIPEEIRAAVRNNGGGHVNHTMFWKLMKPNGGGPPTGAIADSIKSVFGSFDTFKKQFNETGLKRFGSGWDWLIRTKNGKLEIKSTPN
ncbi:MAG: superoxide dismutase, partial [Pyrinomonadaceae bacterium]